MTEDERTDFEVIRRAFEVLEASLLEIIEFGEDNPLAAPFDALKLDRIQCFSIATGVRLVRARLNTRL
jgi:hypothetical protein